MFRTVFGLALIAVLCAASGCTMCCNPYDCSGPVYDQDGCQSSGHYRAGSIFAGDGQVSASRSPAKDSVQDDSAATAVARRKAKTPSRSFSYDFNDSRPSGRTLAKTSQTKTAKTVQPGYVPGSEKIISVTERTVKPAEGATQTVQDSSAKSPRIKMVSESTQQLPTSGWTARRPTREMVR